MLRVLPVIVELALIVFCLVHVVQAPEGAVRHLPKWAWIVLIVFVPIAGPLAYLLAGRTRAAGGARPARGAGRGGARPAAPKGPDDDPEFLRRLGEEHRRRTDGDTPSDPDGGGRPQR